MFSMKYKSGETIELGDWIKSKVSGEKGRVFSINPKCGMIGVNWEMKIAWHGSDGSFSEQTIFTTGHVRPKTIKLLEPEELI